MDPFARLEVPYLVLTRPANYLFTAGHGNWYSKEVVGEVCMSYRTLATLSASIVSSQAREFKLHISQQALECGAESQMVACRSQSVRSEKQVLTIDTKQLPSTSTKRVVLGVDLREAILRRLSTALVENRQEKRERNATHKRCGTPPELAHVRA
jgi:hypothetical protein